MIVVFHGGNEFNPLPSPDTVDRYRFICDMGAEAEKSNSKNARLYK